MYRHPLLYLGQFELRAFRLSTCVQTMENSRSRYGYRTRSPPRQQEEQYRDRSLPRKRSPSSDRKYLRSSSSRPARSPIRRNDSRSPTQRNDLSPGRRQPSRSPERRESRSHSHRQDQNRPPRGGGGFKWKRRGQDDERYERRKEYRGLDRGYRGEQDRKRPQSPLHHGCKEPPGDILPTERPKKEKKEKRTTIATVGEPMIIVNVNDRLGTKASIPCLASDPISNALGFPPPITAITLTIYSELFKALVAAKIGREPHEIMLKRQGERPFKDQLTLEDYGVSNGVQLDL